jgi:hypothetical protein
MGIYLDIMIYFGLVKQVRTDGFSRRVFSSERRGGDLGRKKCGLFCIESGFWVTFSNSLETYV